MSAKIYIVGTGNLATSLGNRMGEVLGRGQPKFSGWVSRNPGGSALKPIFATADFKPESGDYLFICTPDRLIYETANKYRENGVITVHCSGGVAMSDENEGVDAVFYPFQTFHPTFQADWSAIPVFLETKKEEQMQFFRELARAVGGSVYEISSEQRAFVHLAGVFASNFSNAMFLAAENVLASVDLPRSALIPLIIQTARKSSALGPFNAQTGPAMRDDTETMEKHLALLKDNSELQNVYRLLSAYILQNIRNKNNSAT